MAIVNKVSSPNLASTVWPLVLESPGIDFSPGKASWKTDFFGKKSWKIP